MEQLFLGQQMLLQEMQVLRNTIRQLPLSKML